MMTKKQPSAKKSIPPGRKTPVPGRPDRDRRVRQNDRIARVLGVSARREGMPALANQTPPAKVRYLVEPAGNLDADCLERAESLSGAWIARDPSW